MVMTMMKEGCKSCYELASLGMAMAMAMKRCTRYDEAACCSDAVKRRWDEEGVMLREAVSVVVGEGWILDLRR